MPHDVHRESRTDRPASTQLGVEEIRYLSVPQAGVPALLSRLTINWNPGTGLETLRVMNGTTNPGPPYKGQGGDFLKYEFNSPHRPAGGQGIRSDVWTSPRSGFYFAANWPGQATYTGRFVPYTFYGPDDLGDSERMLYDPLYPSFVNLSSAGMQALGNRAYAKLRPQVAGASLTQAIWELRDVPGSLKGSAQFFHNMWQGFLKTKPVSVQRALRDAVAIPKDVSDEFVNYQFGWKPFVGDVVNTCAKIIDLDKTIQDNMASNGQYQKRRFSEPPSVEEDVVFSGDAVEAPYVYPSLGSTYLLSQAYTIKRVKYSRLWYTGSFWTYFPEFDPAMRSGFDSLDSANRIISSLGGGINPTMLYRIMPWTWLVDWFTGLGDLVQRLQDSAGNEVLCDEFYLMRQAREYFQYTWAYVDRQGGTNTLSWYRSMEVKRRDRARGVFNFAANPNGMSSVQKAILGALGLSRLIH